MKKRILATWAVVYRFVARWLQYHKRDYLVVPLTDLFVSVVLQDSPWSVMIDGSEIPSRLTRLAFSYFPRVQGLPSYHGS